MLVSEVYEDLHVTQKLGLTWDRSIYLRFFKNPVRTLSYGVGTGMTPVWVSLIPSKRTKCQWFSYTELTVVVVVK